MRIEFMDITKIFETTEESLLKTEELSGPSTDEDGDGMDEIDANVAKHNIDIKLPKIQGPVGKVCVVGRARVGKSFFTALFVKSRGEYMSVFCGGGSDKTPCPVQNIIIDSEDFNECFVLHSDFSLINKSSSASEVVLKLNRELGKVVNLPITFGNLDETQKAMEKIEGVVRRIKDFEASSNTRKSETYITVYLRSNDYTKKILQKTDLKRLEILDTPGVSGQVEAEKLAKADLYVFILRPENSVEVETLEGVVKQVKQYTSTSKVTFLYKGSERIDDEEDYRVGSDDAKRSMRSFERLFDELKGSIINTDLDILNVSQNTILFPAMNSRKRTAPEEFFLKDIEEKLLSAFDKDMEEETERRKFEELLKNNGDDAKKYVLKILKEIPPHRVVYNSKRGEYTISKFKAERHNRVMTKDHYRLHSDLEKAYDMETRLLDGYFSQFTATNVKEDWMVALLRLLYKALMRSVGHDRGVGVGNHPWEEYPARTMLVEESLNAHTVLGYIVGKTGQHIKDSYKEALKASGVASGTWNYVYCDANDEAMKKLEIIRDTLCEVPVSRRIDMVLCRYIGGLRRIAEYKILKQLQFSDSDCISELKRMPF